MDQGDPERRIAELERQLAQQKRMAEPERLDKRPVVTPEDVHNMAFSKPAIGQRGYNEDEVDVYLDLIEATLRDPTARSGVTQADIHNVTFSRPPIGKRGYNEDEVDAFLDRVEIELTRRLKEPQQHGPQDFGAPAGVVPQPASRGEARFGSHTPSRQQGRWLGIQILGFIKELGWDAPFTWRTPLLVGAGLVVGACTPPASLIALVIGVTFLIWAMLAWHFKWEF
ncbi:MAG: hypothetical protein NVS4B6_02700 [Mycobacterium sp.]